MSNGTTQHTPADVRERVAREVFTLDADWRREYWDQFRRAFPRQAQAYYDTADRILGLFRTPRGEGEGRADRMRAMLAVSQSLSRVVAVMQAAWIEWRRGRGADAAMQWIENTLIGPGLIPGDDESDAQAFFDRAIAEIENHQIRHAAALRSEAPGRARSSLTCESCGEEIRDAAQQSQPPAVTSEGEQ